MKILILPERMWKFMKSAKYAYMLTVLILMLFTAGCSIRENVTQTDTPQPQAIIFSKDPSYYYGFTDEVPLNEDARQKLDDFGAPLSFWPADPAIETFKEIPEIENNAKGIDPITIILPNLDHSKYSGPYLMTDYENNLEVSVYYRVVADIVTDECVKIYINADGKIEHYETVNLGKYDKMELNEEVLNNRIHRFNDAIHAALSSVTLDFIVRGVNHAPSAYAMFTDNEGRLVLKTTTALITECSLNQSSILVDLYAALN